MYCNDDCWYVLLVVAMYRLNQFSLTNTSAAVECSELQTIDLCFLGRDDFQFFWNFITAIQILPCVIETRRYGYIRDSGGRVETPHGATIGCEKSYNG